MPQRSPAARTRAQAENQLKCGLCRACQNRSWASPLRCVVASPGIVRVRAGLLLPVAAEAAAPALGLADIDDRPARVLHQVYARPVREPLERSFEFWGHR